MLEKNSLENGGTVGSAIFNLWKSLDGKKKAAIVATLAVLLLVTGFFVGRKTIRIEAPKPEIVYVPGDTVKIPFDNPVPTPVYIKTPADTSDIIRAAVRSGKFDDLFPTHVKDSIIYITKEDTSAIVWDWATERFYKEKVFDIDTLGTAFINAKTQYNRLEILGTTFVPVQKVVNTNTILMKKFSPFVGAGITTMPSYVISGGMIFDDKYGAALMFQRDWKANRNSAGVEIIYKF